MARYVSIFTKKEHLGRGNMAISAEKMSRLISGDADILVHRAFHQDGPIIYIYAGDELKKLLGRAVKNAHTTKNKETNRDDYYFLVRFTDPNNTYYKPEGSCLECADCDEEECGECFTTVPKHNSVVPF